MNRSLMLLVKLQFFFFGVVVLFPPLISADDYFYSKNVRLERGGIEGEICNKSFVFRDEVIMKMTAVQRSGEEIWHEYTAVAGLGPYQCKSFFETRGYLEKGFDLEFQYYPSKNLNMRKEKDAGGTLVFKNFKVVNRELTGEVCNSKEQELIDLKINTFAVDDRKNVRWGTYFLVDEISPGECVKVSRHVVGDEIHRFFDYYFSVEKVYQNENFQAGSITDEISYKDIVVKYKYLTGRLCNDSEENRDDVFVRFFNMRTERWILWDELVAIPHLEPGECREFSEGVPRDKKPSHWKFTIFGH